MSIIACKWSAWPFNKAHASRSYKTQSHMIALLLNYPKNSSMSEDMYFQHRKTLAGKHAASHGRWSLKWASCVLSWHNHCTRSHDPTMWHAFVLRFQDATWSADRRTKYGEGRISRTCTRLKVGFVPIRLSECLESALAVAPHWSAIIQNDYIYVRTILSASLAD